jgi:hypothetical protein
MTTNKIIDKVTKFLTNEFIQSVGNISIFKNDDGSYELFDRYIINETTNNTFIVSIRSSYTTKTFNSLKNAVTWCTFEKRNKFHQTTRIEHLDKSIGSINVEINMHQNLLKKSNELDKKMIYIAKLNEERLKRKSMTTEMHSYITESKYWQTKKFAPKDQNMYEKINTL